ncbi:protein kinase domain-containing protein [Ktedonobacter racemifer]|uniref:non-specific serine/threonine protein kinase n=1 Tax=Ktedonobacter racemifer DSM 44963 TaxID=485913 RepID=D6U4C6_KTERA|nr:protein kinase [Ktedonobacter racemifer]EFH81356.1 serine/threonine protein kinase [Ktedonobacter racemifer DSM 44963]
MSTSSLSVDELVGQTLGTYQVEQLLGRGSLNAVYQARQEGSARPVMLTTYFLPSTLPPQARARFIARFTTIASSLLQLRHPCVQPLEDFGEHLGLPYMVSPLVSGNTLAELVRERGQLTPLQASRILRRLAEALDYAHNHGFAHGALRPLNIWVDAKSLQVVGFGLVSMLALEGLAPLEHAYPHLLSLSGSFLGAPEYIAPEVVKGRALSARADVYALGAIAFEMLCGRPPFKASDPFELANMHVQQSAPLITEFKADVPNGLDLVLQRALERNPAERYSSAGDFAAAFTRVVQLFDAPQGMQQSGRLAPVSIPGQTMPGITGPISLGGIPPRTPVSGTSSTSMSMPVLPRKIHWQLMPPVVTSKLETVPLTPEALAQQSLQAQQQAMQSAMTRSTQPLAQPQRPMSGNYATVAMEPVSAKASEVQRPPIAPKVAPVSAKVVKEERIEVLAARLVALLKAQIERVPKSRKHMLAVLIVGILVLMIGGMSLAFASQGSGQQASSQKASTSAPARTPKQAASPKQVATPPPTSQGTPIVHTGRVIGNTNQGFGTAQTFTNPEDGRDSLLIRMPNGNFVAYESGCTTDGGTLNYDANSNKLVCPPDGSTFDPANSGNVVSGPATTPRKQIQLHVNPDGTVTIG